jgi:3-dehydroquinate synthase
MAVFHVSKKIIVNSNKGPYSTSFINSAIDELNENPIKNSIYLIDRKICDLYEDRINNILSSQRVIKIDANEENKSLNRMPEYVEELVSLKIKRGEKLVAIGGGIIQDITCFLSSIVMRGLVWIFYPTTLLAQSDSCIGSKSSINSGEYKNILGTFLPPEKVVIDVDFLNTLEKREIFSGIGEMIKIHAISSPESFNILSDSYEKILSNLSVMEEFIFNSLSMKKKLIEIDEFDQGPRNVLNYGHSFGHAIESATNFGIPHGIAVTIGMDIANFVSTELGVSNMRHFHRMHNLLDKNSRTYRNTYIDLDLLLSALSKDKKNSSTELKLILPNMSGKICIGLYKNSPKLKKSIESYIERYRYDF